MTRGTVLAMMLVVTAAGLAILVRFMEGTPSVTMAETQTSTEAWQITPFDSDHDRGSFSSLALNSNGYPYISFRDATSLTAQYQRWDGDQ